MAQINLGSLITDLAALSNIQQQQTTEIATKQAMQGEIGQQIANNMFEVAERRERVETQQLQSQLEAQNQSRRVARAGGMDASASNEILSGMMDQLRTDMLSYQAASRQVQEIERESNLLSNPAGWLNDLLNGDQARADRDAIRDRLQDSQSQLNNMHALTQANVQTQNAIAETLTEASIKDTTRVNALLANNEALQAQQQAEQFTIAGIETLRAYGSEEFNRRISTYNTVLSQQRHEQQLEMSRQQLEQRRREIEVQEGRRESYGEIARLYNEGLERFGLEARPITPEFAMEHWGANTPIGHRMMTIVDRSMQSEDRGSLTLGPNPYATYTFVQSFGVDLPASLDEGTRKSMENAANYVNAQVAEARGFTQDMQTTDAGFTLSNLDDPAFRAEVFNTAFNSSLATFDTEFSDYAIETTFVKSENPEIEQTQFWQSVVKPLEDAGTEPNITTIATQTAEKYAAGQLTSAEASEGLSNLWRSQLDLFNATSGRDAVGAPMLLESNPVLPVGMKYRTSTRSGTIGQLPVEAQLLVGRNLKTGEITEEVDLTSPTNALHWLNRWTSNKIAREMQESAR